MRQRGEIIARVERARRDASNAVASSRARARSNAERHPLDAFRLKWAWGYREYFPRRDARRRGAKRGAREVVVSCVTVTDRCMDGCGVR